jgi:hypothetical protein
MQYATRKPFDFNAGGRGFDLLRMKIFSERYHFGISLFSKRCRHLSDSQDACPGDIAQCDHCRSVNDCLNANGATTVALQFKACGKGEGV